MPLYNISPPIGFKSDRVYLDYTDAEIKAIFSDIKTKFRRYRGNMLPAIYVSRTIFLLLIDSPDFTLYNTNHNLTKVGSYCEGTVYLSKQLSSFEFYIGIEEKEILEYQRFHKLNKIKKKLNVL